MHFVVHARSVGEAIEDAHIPRRDATRPRGGEAQSAKLIMNVTIAKMIVVETTRIMSNYFKKLNQP